MQDMDDEQGAAVSIPIEVDERVPEPKQEKPRGRCTGCAFDYQLGTARTGEHKGKRVIRKHNSRTGPGLCSGAGELPEPEHTEGCTPEARFGPAVCTACDEFRRWADTQTASKTPAGHCVPGRCEGCCGCSSMCTTDPCGPPIVADPWTAPTSVAAVAEALGVQDYASPAVAAIQRGEDPFTAEQKETMAVVAGVFGNTAPLPFTAPAPASDIPESTTTVSGQPDPDRDQYGRYRIHGQAHTRATTFAKLGANTKAIEAWNERNVIRGLTLRPDLLMLANGLEVKKDRQSLNSIAAQAKDAAGSKVAANIGTAYHAFGERLDAGLVTLADIPEQYRHRLQQYQDTLTRAGLTTRPEWIERTTAVRADQVGAPLPVAGTLDRIFQLPDGSLVIGDKKTGSDLSYGEMEIEVQLALYAHGVNTHGLFDWNTKTWHSVQGDGYAPGGPGVRVRTDIAIVVHLPADGDGCTLYVADIERGWRDAQRLGPLQSSLKEKKRFRTLTAADLAPRPAPVGRDEVSRAMAQVGQGEVAQYLAAQPVPVAKNHSETPLLGEHWNRAKNLVAHADSQEEIAQIYQFALDSGRFHVDQLAVLVGLGKDRLNALARG